MLDTFDAVFSLEVVQEPKHCILQQFMWRQALCSLFKQLSIRTVLAEGLFACKHVT